MAGTNAPPGPSLRQRPRPRPPGVPPSVPRTSPRTGRRISPGVVAPALPPSRRAGLTEKAGPRRMPPTGRPEPGEQTSSSELDRGRVLQEATSSSDSDSSFDSDSSSDSDGSSGSEDDMDPLSQLETTRSPPTFHPPSRRVVQTRPSSLGTPASARTSPKEQPRPGKRQHDARPPWPRATDKLPGKGHALVATMAGVVHSPSQRVVPTRPSALGTPGYAPAAPKEQPRPGGQHDARLPRPRATNKLPVKGRALVATMAGVIKRSFKWPQRWTPRLTSGRSLLLGITIGLAVGSALRPSADRLAAKMARLAIPQEPSIIYFNGTLLAAIESCTHLTGLVEMPVVAPPAMNATIPDGIVMHARPVLDLCNFADTIPHRPDVGSHCRDFQSAYDAVMLPSAHQPNDWRHSHKVHCQTMVHGTSSSIQTLADRLQEVATKVDGLYGSDNDDDDLDEALPTLEARLQRGETSDMMAKPIQRSLAEMMATFQIVRDKADEKGRPLATMIDSMSVIADAFGYELSKKSFANGTGGRHMKKIQQLTSKVQSNASRAFLTAALDALEASQSGAQDTINDLEALSADVRRAQDAFEADVRVVSWLTALPLPWSGAVSRYAMNLFPLGPFLEDPFFAQVKLKDAIGGETAPEHPLWDL
ncbi:hypothetical protein QBC39DRAFT_362203 [Podospora conica]|nr:hypothetical protein QBC39DRAFT_362203 [Schizothecium conicum]